MNVVPFEAAHLDTYQPGEQERPYYTVDAAKEAAAHWSDYALSAVEDGKCFGVAIWLVDGTDATLSLWLSDELKQRPSFLYRAVLEGIRKLEAAGITKMKAGGIEGDETTQKWFAHLGFTPTGEEDILMGYKITEYVKWSQ
jgi:hypothetical protein